MRLHFPILGQEEHVGVIAVGALPQLSKPASPSNRQDAVVGKSHATRGRQARKYLKSMAPGAKIETDILAYDLDFAILGAWVDEGCEVVRIDDEGDVVAGIFERFDLILLAGRKAAIRTISDKHEPVLLGLDRC